MIIAIILSLTFAIALGVGAYAAFGMLQDRYAQLDRINRAVNPQHKPKLNVVHVVRDRLGE